MTDLDLARHYYAEELRAAANLQSEAVGRAFAKVPREHFLGPGPWEVFTPYSESGWATKDADPKQLYHNLLVVIDAKRRLNNGLPGFLAFLIDQLELKEGEHAVHVGCGPGYYTAVMAEVVGSHGTVTAVEINSQLAARARSNLTYLPQVKVFEADGGMFNPGMCDAILINAGATHPRSIWLDSLRVGARLLLPLTAADDESGTARGVFKVTREDTGFVAAFVSRVGIFPCAGARDPALNDKLKEAFNRGDAKSVSSLRRDRHEAGDSCWFHGGGYCFSKVTMADMKFDK
jgi:protein-L-isoaspartate(D-aspartate) O-methyltransferase